jgi:hypothetical protein
LKLAQRIPKLAGASMHRPGKGIPLHPVQNGTNKEKQPKEKICRPSGPQQLNAADICDSRHVRNPMVLQTAIIVAR